MYVEGLVCVVELIVGGIQGNVVEVDGVVVDCVVQYVLGVWGGVGCIDYYQFQVVVGCVWQVVVVILDWYG